MRVEIDDLTVDFPARGIRALSGVRLAVAEGEQVALMGRSGAGKSTLLRTMLGAVPTTAGTVRVGGLDPARPAQAHRIRRATGMLRQGGDLVGGVSARTNALMATSPTWRAADWLRVLRGRTPAVLADRLHALARAMGVEDCLDARVDQLSGGQRQRVALVRALLPNPRLLLADEPTAHLDPISAAAAVDGLLATGVTLVVATHDPEVARRFPRVVVLADGTVVADGPGVGALDRLLGGRPQAAIRDEAQGEVRP